MIGRFALALFCVGGLWGLIFWLTGLSVVTIRSVEVVGTVSVSPAAIASSTEKFLTDRYWFIVPRSSIFFYPRESIIGNILDSYPRVEKAEVRFKNFHTVNVTITERETAALWCRPSLAPETYFGEQWDDCFLMDKNGFVFDRFDPSALDSPDVMKFMVSNHFPAYIKFYGSVTGTTTPVGQSYLSPKGFQTSLDFAKNVDYLGVTALAFRERPDSDFDVDLVGGTRLVIPREPDISYLVSNLQAIISNPNSSEVGDLNKIDYIDLRFGSKVFYLLK